MSYLCGVMDDMPQLSIIIPVRNRMGIIGRCLDGVASQTLRPLEVVLVDNGSEDGTMEVLRQWAADNDSDGLKVVVTEETRPGACAARNKGLSLATAPYVAFFDSDDVMHGCYAAEAVRMFRENPDADIVYWKVGYTPWHGDRRVLRYSERDVVGTQIFHSLLSTQAYAVRRDFILRTGGWDETLSIWNDWELGLRLLLAGAKTVACPEVLAEVYGGEQSITGTDYHSRAMRCMDAVKRAREVAVKYLSGKKLRAVCSDLDVVAAILAGNCRREGDVTTSEAVMSSILPADVSFLRKALLRLVSRYVAAGFRGASIWAPPLCIFSDHAKRKEIPVICEGSL